jgi:hypothetical protein
MVMKPTSPAASLQRNRLSAAARFRRRGNDLGAFHSLRVGEAGGELLRAECPLTEVERTAMLRCGNAGF